jgi:hypothetical protein
MYQYAKANILMHRSNRVRQAASHAFVSDMFQALKAVRRHIKWKHVARSMAMNILTKGVAKRLIFSLLLAGSLGGCAYYGPPPSGYDSYSYGYPTYAGPPVSLDLGFGFYDYGRVHHRGHRAHHGHHGGYRGAHHGNRGFRDGGRGRHRGWR